MEDIVVTTSDERETIERNPKSIVALEDEIESLRAQLAEVRMGRDAARSEAQCRSWEIVEKQSQLLATQAHAARLVEALGEAESAIRQLAEECDGDYEFADELRAALSTPINLDALHEALAQECERLGMLAELNSGGCIGSYRLKEEAAAHRARKEGK